MRSGKQGVGERTREMTRAWSQRKAMKSQKRGWEERWDLTVAMKDLRELVCFGGGDFFIGVVSGESDDDEEEEGGIVYSRKERM